MVKRPSLNLPNIIIPTTKKVPGLFKSRTIPPSIRLPLSPSRNQVLDVDHPPSMQQYDVLYEHQRGFYILGIPKFSTNLLNPMDPPAWCDKNLKGVATDISCYPLPDPTWEWVDDKWMIDMSGDVDPNGWQYAFRFRQHTWRGDSKAFHNFVRRRRWIRLRRKIPLDYNSIPNPQSPHLVNSPSLSVPSTPISGFSSESASLAPPSSTHSTSELVQKLISSRVDREKILLIQEELKSRTYASTPEEINELLSHLEYESSRRKLLKWINELDGSSDLLEDPIGRLASKVTSHHQRSSSLSFYSDVKSLASY